MVERMCEKYGSLVGEFHGQNYYSFPEIETLAQPGVEEALRNQGFGYRAKYIAESARQIMHKDSSGWLMELREKPLEEAREQLLQLSGVGPKV